MQKKALFVIKMPFLLNAKRIVFIFTITNHLGNVRLSYSKNLNGSAEVLEENNYYPFGLKHEGYNALGGNPSYNYEYNGKELQQETGWNDYGARMYMSDLGRWGVIDPLAEQMRRYSPYNYAFNNPVSFVYPDGRKPMIYNAGGIMRWEFDPATTINGLPWFEGPALSYSGLGGSEFMAQGGGGDGSKDSGGTPGSGERFVESQVYRDIMGSSYFSGIDFLQFADDITVGKDGKVKSFVRNGKPNRFFDEKGKELFFNDPKNVDKSAKNKKYNMGDQVYYLISRKEYMDALNSVTSNYNIIRLLTQARVGNILIAPSAQIAAYSLIGYESTWGEADFSAHYLSRKLDIGNNVNQNDASYHFRFEGTNTIYSLMDAGNFMWGGWSAFIGLFDNEVFGGSHLNEIINGRVDSKADQRAIFNGRRF